MPSRGFAACDALTRTMVSPERTTTEPCACLASLPVSIKKVHDPILTSRLWRLTLCIEISKALLADAKTLDQLGVPIRVFALEVVQQTPALANELEEAAAQMVVLRVRLEVVG